MRTDTTTREPKHPDFRAKAEFILSAIPAQISTMEWHKTVQTLANLLQNVFVEGMQEAKERIKHDPSLAN